MDLYSLFTNTKTAELIFNLSIQIIAVSLAGWIIMKLWSPRSAPARSAGYLTILVSLALLPVISTMFNLNRITWFQPTIELPQSYTRQASLDNFNEFQKFPVEKIIIANEKSETEQGTFKKNEAFDPAPVSETAYQRNEPIPDNEQQEIPVYSEQDNIPFLTRDLILQSVNIFGGIWIAGFIVFILRLGFKLSFLKGYMYNLNTGDTERLKNIYNSIKHVFKDKPIPDISFSSSLSSPVTIGIIRPVMILPVEMEHMSDDELKSILLHELAHIFHRDNFIGFFQHVLSSIFWWNPLVYYLNSAYSDSREDVCDNYAINVLKSPKKYANTLLSLAEKTHLLSHMPATAGMSLSRRSLEHRVLDLLRTDRDLSTIYKPSLLILSLLVAIIITSCGTGMKLKLKYADYPDNPGYFKISKKPVWVIGNDIIKRLNAGEFKDIEKYIDKLVKKKPYTVDGTRVLEKLYPFVAERLESPDMLDKWCAEEDSHQASFIFRGNFYISEAWKHRGHGLGYTVTDEGRRKFRENLELAKNDLEKAYSINPEDPNCSVHMITVCLGLGLGEEEMDIWFKRAVAVDPIAYSAYARKQNFIRPKWYGTKEKDKAFAEHCYENSPPKSIIHEIMLDYIIENYRGAGNKSVYFSDPLITKRIEDVVQRTLKIFPDSTSIRSKLAEIERLKGNYGQAIELYSEILTIEPGNPDALSKRGKLYAEKLRKSDLAEADFKMSIESDPYGPANYEELASIARMNGDYRKAIEYLTMAIIKKPKNPQLYIDRGAIKRSPLHEYDSALEDFKQAVKLDSNHVTGNFYMALCYESMQQLEEAEKYRIKTLSLIEARSPGKARSLPPAFANDIKNKLIAMQRRLEQGSSPRQTTQGTFYPKEINYTIDPSPGEGWEKISAEPFNDMAFNLPSKLTTIYVGRIPVPDGNNLHPAEIFRGWIDGMQKKYDYKNFKIKSSGTTTIDGRKSYYAVYEYNFRDIIKREKDYIIQGNSVFYRIRYNSHINTYNENLQTFERYVTSFKIAANQIPMRNMNNLPIQNRKIIHVLPGEILSQYTGTYKLNPDTNIIISLLNNRLISQLTGQGVVALLNESNMKFVNSKSNTEVEFFKDESGNITHLILTQDGVEKKAVRTSDKVTDGNTVTLTADTLSQYVGTYKMNPDLNLMITMENNQLFAQFPGLMLKALLPESETLFFDNIIDTRLEFIKDASGKVSHLLFIQNNVAITAPRINDKKVSITEESQKEIGEDLGSVKGSSTDSGSKGGTLKVIVDMPQFSGLNAGSNAVDINNVNRAVSDLLVLDNTGKKSVTLHMNGKDTFFEGGTVLTVYFNVWKGEQSNEDYKYNGRKTVTIDGNTTITFKEVSIPNNYGLSEHTAIITGGGPRGERAYLDMLCGPNGEKIKYKRLGSCCAFETPNSAFNDTGLLDIYEITYEGLSEPVKIYLNMYDPPNDEFFAPPEFRMISNFIKNRQIILDNDRSFYFNREFKYTAKKGDKLTVLRSQPCLSNPNQECWCLRHEVYGVGCTGAMPYLLKSDVE